MTKFSFNQKGFGVVGVVIFLAVLFAALNAYAYYNPSFSLAKYSPVNYFRLKVDEERIKDLNRLADAIGKYYTDNGEIPTTDGWCGRISGVLHPELKLDLEDYFPNKDIPNDPSRANTNSDYFYYRVDRSHYILMAQLDIPKSDTKGEYNYDGCHDWPGDDVYNYQINNLEAE